MKGGQTTRQELWILSKKKVEPEKSHLKYMHVLIN